MSVYKNLTDFEKLLYATKYIAFLKKDIKLLNIENGKLKSEIHELEYRLKKENPKGYKLGIFKEQIIATSNNLNKYRRLYEEYFMKWFILKNA